MDLRERTQLQNRQYLHAHCTTRVEVGSVLEHAKSKILDHNHTGLQQITRKSTRDLHGVPRGIVERYMDNDVHGKVSCAHCM